MIESTTIPRKPDSESWSRWKLKKVTSPSYRDSPTRVAFVVIVLVGSEVIFKIHLSKLPFRIAIHSKFQTFWTLLLKESSVKILLFQKVLSRVIFKNITISRVKFRGPLQSILVPWKWPSTCLFYKFSSSRVKRFLEETYHAFKYFRYCFIVSIFAQLFTLSLSWSR